MRVCRGGTGRGDCSLARGGGIEWGGETKAVLPASALLLVLLRLPASAVGASRRGGAHRARFRSWSGVGRPFLFRSRRRVGSVCGLRAHTPVVLGLPFWLFDLVCSLAHATRRAGRFSLCAPGTASARPSLHGTTHPLGRNASPVSSPAIDAVPTARPLGASEFAHSCLFLFRFASVPSTNPTSYFVFQLLPILRRSAAPFALFFGRSTSPIRASFCPACRPVTRRLIFPAFGLCLL